MRGYPACSHTPTTPIPGAPEHGVPSTLSDDADVQQRAADNTEEQFSLAIKKDDIAGALFQSQEGSNKLLKALLEDEGFAGGVLRMVTVETYRAARRKHANSAARVAWSRRGRHAVLTSRRHTPTGLCGRILDAAIDGRWQMVASPQLMAELDTVFARDKFRRWMRKTTQPGSSPTQCCGQAPPRRTERPAASTRTARRTRAALRVESRAGVMSVCPKSSSLNSSGSPYSVASA